MDRQVSKTMENYCLIYLYTSSSADSSFPHQPALHPFCVAETRWRGRWWKVVDLSISVYLSGQGRGRKRRGMLGGGLKWDEEGLLS